MKWKITAISVLVIFWLLLSCTASSERPKVIHITQFVTCKSWTKAGEPLGVTQTFSSTVETISVCAKSQKYGQKPLFLSVKWFHVDYEDEFYRGLVEVDERYFQSTVRPQFLEGNWWRITPTKETFRPGPYVVELYADRTVLTTTTFTVTQ